MNRSSLPCTVTLRDGREVIIREATPDDALGLLLLIDSIAREERWLLNYSAYWGVEGQRSWLRSVESGGGITLLAETRGGEIVGWAEVARPRQPLAHHTATLGTGISREYRDVGLGTKLLTRITDEARWLGIEKLELTVRSPNKRAIRLYKKLGWKREGVDRRAFKHNGEYEDRIHMGLWLGDAATEPGTDPGTPQ